MSFMAVLAVYGSANTFAAVSSDRISGAQMKQRINSFLAAQNLAGKPAISEKDYSRLVNPMSWSALCLAE